MVQELVHHDFAPGLMYLLPKDSEADSIRIIGFEIVEFRLFICDWLSRLLSRHIDLRLSRRVGKDSFIFCLYLSNPPGVFHFQPTKVCFFKCGCPPIPPHPPPRWLATEKTTGKWSEVSPSLSVGTSRLETKLGGAQIRSTTDFLEPVEVKYVGLSFANSALTFT